MAETVKVPGVGPTKKGYVIAGVAVLAGILGVAYWRHSQNAAAAAAPAAAATTTGTDPNAIDPATGLTYAEEAAGGAYAYNPYNQTGYVAPDASTISTTGGSYTSNAQWAQASEDYLVNSTGADANTVAAALGKYLTGGTVTTDQQTVINSAIAFSGYPPVNGPNGYPPSMHIQQPAPSGGGTGGGTGGGGTGTGAGLITVPDLAGQSAGNAHNALVALGLVPTAPPSQRANMKVWYTNPRAGSMVSRGTHVTIDTKGYV